MKKYTKFILAAAGVLLPFLDQVGVPLPDFLTLAWLQGIILAATPVLVLMLPNISASGQNLSSKTSSPALVGILAILLASMALGACSGTRAAYKAADGIDETAKVVGEHYYAVVREANLLAEAGALTGANLRQAQDLVRSTRPAVLEMASTAQAFEAVKSAENEAELQLAINAAAIAISRIVDLLKRHTDSASLNRIEAEIDAILVAQADLALAA